MAILGTDQMTDINTMLNQPIFNALKNRLLQDQANTDEAKLPYIAPGAAADIGLAQAQTSQAGANTKYLGSETTGKDIENSKLGLQLQAFLKAYPQGSQSPATIPQPQSQSQQLQQPSGTQASSPINPMDTLMLHPGLNPGQAGGNILDSLIAPKDQPQQSAQQGQAPQSQPSISDQLQNLKTKVSNDEAWNSQGFFVPPTNKIAYNQAIIQANQGLHDALTSEVADPNDPQQRTWAQLAKAIPAGKTNDAGILADQFIDKHPEIQYLPDVEKAQYSKDKLFTAPQQPNMASVIIGQEGKSKGMGQALAEQVASGNLPLDAALSSINNNRFMLGDEKQKELIALASAVPQLGGGYTIPQLKVFAKNSTDPQTNRTISAINAIEPNLQKIVQFSDQNGRLNIPLLNKAIQAGQFQEGDQTITDMNELQRIIAEEAGRVFGGTATSDFKIKLGGQTVDLSLGQDNFGNTMKVLSDAMQNKKGSLTQAMGPYSPWAKVDQANPQNAGLNGTGANGQPDVTSLRSKYGY